MDRDWSLGGLRRRLRSAATPTGTGARVPTDSRSVGPERSPSEQMTGESAEPGGRRGGGAPEAAAREPAGAADGVTDPAVRLEDVRRSFGDETAVDGLSLSVAPGELLTLLGPSGCGKTTTLRLLAGLAEPDAGLIRVDGETVAGGGRFVPPDRRDVGLVFQEFALFPHLTVAENVAFGIESWPAGERADRVAELLELVGLPGYAEHRPDELSGGQRQRIALARSLAPEPAVLLLDEPFSNLDVGLRTEMREEVRDILKAAGVTAISVTHDQEEALSIGDRVAVMHDGDLEQIGRPEAVFEHPNSRFVAEFLGQAGFLTGRLEAGGIETDVGTLPIEMIEGLGPSYDGASVDVLVRPDDLRAHPVAEEGGETDEDLRAHPVAGEGEQTEGERAPEAGNGRIVHRQYTGPAFVYRVELDSGDVVHCEHNHDENLEIDRRVRVDLTADHTLAWFPAE